MINRIALIVIISLSIFSSAEGKDDFFKKSAWFTSIPDSINLEGIFFDSSYIDTIVLYKHTHENRNGLTRSEDKCFKVEERWCRYMSFYFSKRRKMGISYLYQRGGARIEIPFSYEWEKLEIDNLHYLKITHISTSRDFYYEIIKIQRVDIPHTTAGAPRFSKSFEVTLVRRNYDDLGK